MKIHSLTILHYGKDYLSYALRSVYSQVDQCHVFYTPTPSHGHSTDIPPIETREELQQAAYDYDPDNKIKWYDMLNVTHEGPQRDLALKTIADAGAEIVVVVDCDEIWNPTSLNNCLQHVKSSNRRNHLVNMTHLWRSFNWCCKDQGWPVRIIDLRKDDSKSVGYMPASLVQVYHFGYAITDQLMHYKWKIHGHKNELRPGWFEQKWYQWPPLEDCHPTNDKGFWTPEPFDKAKLPVFMCEHPFFNLEIIE